MASLGSLPAIGQILAHRRTERGLSLQSLAKVSGVSKSMISQVENGQVNPTLAVLWKLANGLGLSLHDLLEGEATRPHEAEFQYLTESNCPTLTSAEKGYKIQILSGIDMVDRVELYLIEFDPAGEMQSHPHAKGTKETLTVIRGEVEVLLGEAAGRKLRPLQSATYSADVTHSIRAAGRKGATIYLAVRFEKSLK